MHWPRVHWHSNRRDKLASDRLTKVEKRLDFLEGWRRNRMTLEEKAQEMWEMLQEKYERDGNQLAVHHILARIPGSAGIVDRETRALRSIWAQKITIPDGAMQDGDTLDIRAFHALQELCCTAHIRHIDLSANPLLHTLNLSGTEVADVAPLASCTVLHTLNLSHTKVANMAPLASCTALHTLNLSHTKVANVAPLASCTALGFLDISDTMVADVLPLAGCQALHTLSLGYYWSSGDDYITHLDMREFHALQELRCNSWRPLEYINVTGNPLLRVLELRYDGDYSDDLMTLNLTANPGLEELSLNGAYATLGLSQKPKLHSLRLGYCGTLTQLDLTHNTELVSFDLYCDEITELDLSKATLLNTLCLTQCNLITLNLSHNTVLEDLYMAEMEALTEMDLSNNTQLRKLSLSSCAFTSLDLSQNTVLEVLGLSGMECLTELDLSCNTQLRKLSVGCPALTDIDVSQNTALEELSVHGGPVPDLSTATQLKSVSVYSCAVAKLTLSGVAKLEKVSVLHGESLTHIDLRYNPALHDVVVHNCQALTHIDLRYTPELHIVNSSDCPSLTTISISAPARIEATRCPLVKVYMHLR